MSVPQDPGRPLFGNCLIRPEKLAIKTKSGIEIPDNAPKGNTIIGRILATGSGSLALDGSPIPMEVEPGARVIYKKYEVEEVAIMEEKLHIVDQRQILYVLHQ